MNRQEANSKLNDLNKRISLLENDIESLKSSESGQGQDLNNRNLKIQEMEMKLSQLGAEKLTMEKSQDSSMGVDEKTK
jgi:hypothetical protein